MEDEKVLELIKMQMKPKIHIGIEEKIPTTQYGNKTYTINVSMHVDNIDENKIKELINMANRALLEQKKKEGLLSEKELNTMARELREKAMSSKGIPYLSKKDEPSLIEQAIKKVEKEGQ